LYRAKAAGRGSVELYTDDLRDWSVARKTQVEKLSDKLARLQKENRVLSEAATIDCRTNLANTASFDADHGQLHAGFERSHDPYSLLIVDIDHFHDYNSRYGYLEGNKSLPSRRRRNHWRASRRRSGLPLGRRGIRRPPPEHSPRRCRTGR